MINKLLLAKVLTCSKENRMIFCMVKNPMMNLIMLNTIEDQMSFDKAGVRQIIMKILKSMLNKWK